MKVVALRAALVFEGIGFFDVGLAVFCGRYGFLLGHLLSCGPKTGDMTHAEKIAMLKQRLRPVVVKLDACDLSEHVPMRA